MSPGKWPADKTRMIVNGHDLHIECSGPEQGPAVVLLHHGLGSLRAWKEQTTALAQAGWRVLAYDRWGYGESQARPALDLPTFNTDLQDLQAILAGYAMEKVALVGHSDGGTMALYYAAQHPGQVTCLVTVAAHIYVEAKMEPGILGIRQAFEQDQRFRQGLRGAHGEKYPGVFHNWFDGWHRIESLSWDMRPLLGSIRCRALIVQGEDDEHATPQQARDIAAGIPRAELWLVPHARHMLPQECAGLFTPRLIKFLNQCREG
jgi:pimeloyl-ACP methyl ester carboxylesterase